MGNENYKKNDASPKKYGTNRAQITDEITLAMYENYINKKDEKGVCVFISHKSQDSIDAKAIADYIRLCGIDVYIDLDDNGLKLASITEDSEGIVKHIQKGLGMSTHLLAIISDNTKESWWVPYEIGYAKKASKKISSLVLRKLSDKIPDYLKIEEILISLEDLKEYAKCLICDKNRYRDIFENTIILPEVDSLSPYIWKG